MRLGLSINGSQRRVVDCSKSSPSQDWRLRASAALPLKFSSWLILFQFSFNFTCWCVFVSRREQERLVYGLVERRKILNGLYSPLSLIYNNQTLISNDKSLVA